ncbi:MAG: glycoside hydrolase family 28 protein, partial [Flavisolibacter sp.]
ILNYGAIGDGKTLNTSVIQKALADCHQHGGGVVEIPTGSFLTGTLRLYSNMNLHFQPGASLVGSTDNKDYGYQKDFGFGGLGAGNKTGILVAHNEQNISITGFGAIRGNGTSFMYMDSLQYGMDFERKYTRQKNDYMNPKYGREDGPVLWRGSYEERPGVMVMFSSCRNVTVSQVSFEESPNWTMAFLNSEHINVNGIAIRNNMLIPNSDGVDFYDSKNIVLSNCDIHAGDDAIAIISSSNLSAANCILQSRSSGIRIGYNVWNQNNSGNLMFNNITIYDSNRGIGIFQRQKGDMENIMFSNIIINTRLHSGQWWGHGEPIHISSAPGLGSKESGSISHVHFSNIIASAESGIVIYATAKDLINDISFDNVNLSIKNGPLTKSYGGNIDLRPTNDISLGIFEHTTPAVYANYVTTLSINNFTVSWGKNLPAWFTHAVQIEHFESVNINGLHEVNSNSNNLPVIYLSNGKGANVKEISSKVHNKKLVLTDNKS